MAGKAVGTWGDDHLDDCRDREDEPASAAYSLMADLDALVQAGVLVEIHERGRPSRYALSTYGRALVVDDVELRAARLTEELLPSARQIEAEACPHCGSPAGYDAGARCRSCLVAFLPEGVIYE